MHPISARSALDDKRARGRRVTASSIESLKPRTKRYEVTDPAIAGLQLRVAPTGVKSWIFRYYWRGARQRLALGLWPNISLAQAREMTRTAHQLIRANNVGDDEETGFLQARICRVSGWDGHHCGRGSIRVGRGGRRKPHSIVDAGSITRMAHALNALQTLSPRRIERAATKVSQMTTTTAINAKTPEIRSVSRSTRGQALVSKAGNSNVRQQAHRMDRKRTIC